MAFQGMDVDQAKGEYTKLNTAIGELEKQMGDLTRLSVASSRTCGRARTPTTSSRIGMAPTSRHSTR